MTKQERSYCPRVGWDITRVPEGSDNALRLDFSFVSQTAPGGPREGPGKLPDPHGVSPTLQGVGGGSEAKQAGTAWPTKPAREPQGLGQVVGVQGKSILG